MAVTITRSVNFESLNLRGQSAVTVIKLMMACNDLTLTNLALGDWKIEARRSRKSRQAGACMYFLRAQIGHLFEGLKVIEEIHTDLTLSKLVSRCSAQAQTACQELQHYVPDGCKRKRFEQLAGKIRHSLAFHYDESGKLIKRAIDDRAARPEARTSLITRANVTHLWHFKVADAVVDSIVVRQLWKIPRELDLHTEADRTAEEVHRVFLFFLDFAGEFIWKYCED